MVTRLAHNQEIVGSNPTPAINIMNKLIITIISLCLATVSYAANLAVTADADYYLYYGTYNSTRTPLYVGINDLVNGSPYQYHFNFVGIELNDISNFNSGDTALLKLNLQRFRVPVAVDPSYQGPPSYQYLTSGVSFTIKAVALTDSFSSLETNLSPLDWYKDNLLNRPAIDEVTFNQSGEVVFNITSALNSWKIAPLTNYGIGLIGTYSSVTGSTAQFYSSEYVDGLLTPSASIIPEPSSLSYIICAVFLLGMVIFLHNRK